VHGNEEKNENNSRIEVCGDGDNVVEMGMALVRMAWGRGRWLCGWGGDGNKMVGICAWDGEKYFIVSSSIGHHCIS